MSWRNDTDWETLNMNNTYLINNHDSETNHNNIMNMKLFNYSTNFHDIVHSTIVRFEKQFLFHWPKCHWQPVILIPFNTISSRIKRLLKSHIARMTYDIDIRELNINHPETISSLEDVIIIWYSFLANLRNVFNLIIMIVTHKSHRINICSSNSWQIDEGIL
jgi:hypothetical protein